MSKYELTLEGQTFTVEVKSVADGQATVAVNGKDMSIAIKDLEAGAKPVVKRPAPASAPIARSMTSSAPVKAPPSAGGKSVTAPIPGAIMEIYVKAGDAVKPGQPVLKMEAMKMENEINSEVEGVITTVCVSPGETVSQGQALVIVE